MATAITATGIKGFLLWLKVNQPGIYAKVAPTLPKLVPEAFTAINKQTLGKLRAIYKSGFRGRSAQRLGDYGDYFTGSYASYDSAPITTNYTNLSMPYSSYSSYALSPCAVSVNYANLSAAPCVGPICAPDQLSCPSYSCPSVNTGADIADAANTGNAAAGTVSAIGSAVNAVAQGVLTVAQAAELAQIVQSQLQNAQSGIAPKNVTTASLGIPTVAATTSKSTSDLILLALAGLAAWAVMS